MNKKKKERKMLPFRMSIQKQWHFVSINCSFSHLPQIIHLSEQFDIWWMRQHKCCCAKTLIKLFRVNNKAATFWEEIAWESKRIKKVQGECCKKTKSKSLSLQNKKRKWQRERKKKYAKRKICSKNELKERRKKLTHF